MGILDKFIKSSDKYTSRTVLVVDDNEVDRKIIESALDKLGCKVLSAVNGEEGYQLALDNSPDLILSDCMMPKLDGVEMTKKIRNDQNIKSIPVIFLTGADSPRTVIDCFEVEAHNYMCKPINAKVLTNQIKEILDEYLKDAQDQMER